MTDEEKLMQDDFWILFTKNCIFEINNYICKIVVADIFRKNLSVFTPIRILWYICWKSKHLFTYSIHGVLPDDSFNGKYVVLTKAYFKFFEEPVIIDSVKIKNREFTFKGKVNEEPFLANLFAGHTELGEFIMEPGHIHITLRNDTYLYQIVIKLSST